MISRLIFSSSNSLYVSSIKSQMRYLMLLEAKFVWQCPLATILKCKKNATRCKLAEIFYRILICDNFIHDVFQNSFIFYLSFTLWLDSATYIQTSTLSNIQPLPPTKTTSQSTLRIKTHHLRPFIAYCCCLP